MPDLRKEVYLGDGLFASFDGYSIKLRTSREHPTDNYAELDHWVGLDPIVLAAFEEYVAVVREEIAKVRQA